MNRIFVAAAIAAAVAATSCGNGHDCDATGIFEATTVTLSAETAGRILAIDVAEGDSVVPGARVALVDTALLALQRLQMGSQLESAMTSLPDIAAQVASLRTQIAHQEHECRRLENLLADGAATGKQVDDAAAALRTLRGQLDAQLSALDKSRGSISGNADAMRYQQEQINEQIARSSIVSPIAGVVLQKYAEAGEYAMPGKQLLKVADLDNVYLRCYFTAVQLADVRVGQLVTVVADFGGDARFEYQGTITWIADESEFTPKSIHTADTRSNLVYAAKVAVCNDGRLKLGQYGEVRL